MCGSFVGHVVILWVMFFWCLTYKVSSIGAGCGVLWVMLSFFLLILHIKFII